MGEFLLTEFRIESNIDELTGLTTNLLSLFLAYAAVYTILRQIGEIFKRYKKFKSCKNNNYLFYSRQSPDRSTPLYTPHLEFM